MLWCRNLGVVFFYGTAAAVLPQRARVARQLFPSVALQFMPIYFAAKMPISLLL